ncbi:MAG: PAS domain-containing protein [Nitrospirae bacterium]|nr:PAS domain-containing protein [Nitrospirota bacterium]
MLNIKSLFRVNRKGIGYLFAVYILMFSSVFTLVGTVMQLALDYFQSVNLIETRISQIETSYLPSLSYSLWVNSVKDLEINMEGIKNLPDMQYLEIKSDEGKVLLAVGRPQEKHIISHNFKIEYLHRGKQVYVGQLLVVATLDRVYQSLKEKIVVILVTQTVKTFLVSFFIIFLFHKLVGRYLKDISAFIANLKTNEWQKPLKLIRNKHFVTKDDELEQLVSTFNDLRMRTLISKKQLEQEKERIQVTLMSIGDGVIITNIDSHIELLNPVAEQLTGWPLKEAVGRYLSEVFNAVNEDTSAPVINPVEQCVAQGKSIGADGNISLLKSHVKDIYIEYSVAPIKNKKGEIKRVVLVFRDITQRKQMADEIKTINLNLQKRVDEEVSKNRTKDQLMFEQSKYISMNELLMNISHHWRQPLCAIGVSIQDIKDAYLHGDLDELYITNNVNNSMSELVKLSETIDNFRNFYIQEEEQLEFNIADEINKAESLLSGYVRDKGIVIDKELDESLTIQGFPNEFAHVILNILTNAKDKFEERKITAGIIKVKLNKDSTTGKVIISVSDNGGEIPNDIINKVFDPYFTTGDITLRTGMGLYMAKVIVEQNMKGTISVRNIDGWCEFRIEI